MPGPGSRKKPGSKGTKLKPSFSPATTNDAYVDDIDRAGGWHIIVNILCDMFKLPDMTTRSGLKKIHANFDSIYRTLDNAYQKYGNNERMRGGIIGIYAKMCVDSILRNKLFERGLLDKLMPLLDVPLTRQLALRALGTVTHHGGSDIRMQIAKHSAVLTKLADDNPDDEKIAELAVTTLAHSVVAVVEGGELPNYPETCKQLDMPTILRVVVECVKKLTASSHAINHAMKLFALCTLHAAPAYKVYPSATRFLVAGLRSKDWVSRCICLGGLLRLHQLEAEDDQRDLNPNRFMAALQRGFPDHLNDIMMDYGPTICETYLTMHTSRDFQMAMMQVVQDHDLYSLGMKISEYILRTEFSVAHGIFQAVDINGKTEVMDVGLPFTMWGDALPHCARAIRARKKPCEVDWADILDIKYDIMQGRIPVAVDKAKKGLLRNPECAYFYYAISLAADSVQGLRASKKGMKCKQITPFVKFQLMQRAIEYAGDMGVRILQDSPSAGDQKWEEGIAFLMSALEDSKTYVEQAPPDNRHMKNISYWYILLTIAMKEAEMSPDLGVLQGALKKLKIADEFSEFIGVPPPKTSLRLAQQTVVKLYPEAVKEFSDVIAKTATGSGKEHPEVSPEKLEDDLASWLDEMHLDRDREVKSECTGSHPKINTNNVSLYRCSWCGNPSAVLRKCSGCAKTRYCDSGCQKSHWPDHKKICITSASH